jgi:hypothetical protein
MIRTTVAFLGAMLFAFPAAQGAEVTPSPQPPPQQGGGTPQQGGGVLVNPYDAMCEEHATPQCALWHSPLKPGKGGGIKFLDAYGNKKFLDAYGNNKDAIGEYRLPRGPGGA